jgi:hypothetical protein
MFADILQDEWKRSRRDITRRMKTTEELESYGYYH